MPPQMNTPTATVAGAPGPMSGPKSGIPPNLPPPQMPPANASATGQMQQVIFVYFCVFLTFIGFNNKGIFSTNAKKSSVEIRK